MKDGYVYFTYRNYKNGIQIEMHRLKILSFMRHFLLHIVPERFVRIRYYGQLSRRNKKKAIEECSHYYELKQAGREERSSSIELYQKLTGIDLRRCSVCNKGMVVTIKTMNSYRAPPG